LRKFVNEGKVVVDSQYETEDPKNPKAYKLWKNNFEYRLKNGYFNNIGTYMLDSCTTWSTAIMYWVQEKAGLAGTIPRMRHDYQPQKKEIENFLRVMIDLPCNFILTAHLEAEVVQEGESTSKEYRFMTTGKGVVTVPLMFDEIWVMEPRGAATGVEYRCLLKSTGKYLARSRLAEDGVLDKYEKPDIKAILKKAGKDYSDKPLLI
jgi:hypothetical protein